jgi:hypothetical protein
MFFLPLNVTSDLRNLRLAHRERTIPFLPRKRATFIERSRSPRGRIRFDFADHLRHRLVLPQLCQNVNMVRGSVHNQRDSVFAANCAAEVFMNARANRYRHPRFTVLCGKHNVIQEIAIGGTHSGGPFRRPCSGALSFFDDIPGVPLRSTPSCSSAALHCRLYSVAPPALSSVQPGAQRRRRDGLERVISPDPRRCSDSTHSRPGVAVIGRLAGPASEARRIKARSGAQRNSGTSVTTRSETPDKGWRKTRSNLAVFQLT